MPKKSSSQPAAPKVAPPETSIDDIFASKPKKLPKPSSQSSINAIASSSKSTLPSATAPTTSSEPPRKKKKKSKGSNIPAFVPAESETSLRSSLVSGNESSKRIVQEVLDPSVVRASEVIKPPTAVPGKNGGVSASGMTGKQKRKEQQVEDDDDLFADSRGTGPRRKTEEGFLIYKEAELQIDPEAGGTPLCPFDCDCCF